MDEEQLLNRLFNVLPDVQVPSMIAQRTLDQIYRRKALQRFTVLFVFLMCNFALSLWHAWNRSVETEVVSFFLVVMNDFEFSVSYFSDTITTLFEIAPLISYFLVLGNMIAAGYTLWMYRSLFFFRKGRLTHYYSTS